MIWIAVVSSLFVFFIGLLLSGRNDQEDGFFLGWFTAVAFLFLLAFFAFKNDMHDRGKYIHKHNCVKQEIVMGHLDEHSKIYMCDNGKAITK